MICAKIQRKPQKNKKTQTQALKNKQYEYLEQHIKKEKVGTKANFYTQYRVCGDSRTDIYDYTLTSLPLIF